MKITLLTDATLSRPGRLLKGKKGQAVDWPDDFAQGLIAAERAKPTAPKPAKKSTKAK